ncbi:MAG: hypothetical protein LBL67_06450 [Coriobacteriales bacterium]|jgi:hypothetical protein|nr:hypothetical protein [Coriobacteriales bacterium]
MDYQTNYQPQPQAQMDQPPAVVIAPRELTGAQKAGYFFFGFFGGFVNIIGASLFNLEKPYRSEGTKWTAIGFAVAAAVGIVLVILYTIFVVWLVGMAQSNISSSFNNSI